MTSRHSAERDPSMVSDIVPVPRIVFIFNKKMHK